jgi:hypothetical protein
MSPLRSGRNLTQWFGEATWNSECLAKLMGQPARVLFHSDRSGGISIIKNSDNRKIAALRASVRKDKLRCLHSAALGSTWNKCSTRRHEVECKKNPQASLPADL